MPARRPVPSLVAALSAALVAGAGAVAVLAEDAPTAAGAARVVGLSVARPKADGSFGGSLASGLLAGTGVHVLLNAPGARVLSVDTDASKLASFTDDRGSDLSGRDQWIWPFAEPSEDGSEVVVQFRSEKVPAGGAREIRVRATVAFRTGADPKAAETKGVALREGSVIDAGFAKWKVKSAARDGRSIRITVESDTPFDAVTAVEFTGSDGKKSAAEERGGWGFSMNGKGSWSKDYEAEAAGDAVTVRVSYWGTCGTVSVPVDVAVGVGF